jgi:tetraacyldisaccharide 4'-kinase
MRAPEFWQAGGGAMAALAGGLLAPLGAAWDAGGRLRRAMGRPYRPPVPVICVGNLVAGGAGKTPVVVALAALVSGMRAGPFDPHVVMRGYGGRLAGPLRVDPVLHDAAAVGDEPLLVAVRRPCWIARDRAAGARAAVAAGATAIILDDGFQSPAIAKDCSLVVVDAEYGFGNRRVIPAGPLRESVAAGLARADAVVLLGDGPPPAELTATRLPVLRAALAPVGGNRFAGARVVAFAGIGRPEKFFASLHRIGAELLSKHPFPDHHPFAAAEIVRLRREASNADARLVTTAKDWVRLPPPLRPGIEVFEVEIGWHDRPAVLHLLGDVLRQDTNRSGRRAAGA